MHVRIARTELRQRIGQQRDVRDGREAHADVAVEASLDLVDLLARPAQLAAHGVRAADEKLAHRGDGHALRLPLEQRDAELAFELLDASRQRRLCDAKRTRRRAQTAALGDRQHVAQLVQFHGDAIMLSPAQFGARLHWSLARLEPGSIGAWLDWSLAPLIQ